MSDLTDDERKQYDDWKASKNHITKIEVQAEKIEHIPKEKKPRTEKQLEATKRMREALSTKRKDHNDKKTEHTELYKQKMTEAYEKADKIKELVPNAKLVVKSRVGRPKGVKNNPIEPTPAVSDDDEEELIVTAPIVKERTVPIKKPVGKLITPHNISSVDAYLRKLNGR